MRYLADVSTTVDHLNGWDALAISVIAVCVTVYFLLKRGW